MKLLRRGLLLLVLTAAGAWLAASAALAFGLPVGWHIARWPVSIPGLAATSPEGVTLRWSPVDWRGLRLAGQNFIPRGSRLGAVTTLDASPLKLFCSVIDSSLRPPDKRAGTILLANETGIAVQCGQGVLRITELQRTGGKRLPVADFLRGSALAPGTVLGLPAGSAASSNLP